jgi:hypothetical protein
VPLAHAVANEAAASRALRIGWMGKAPNYYILYTALIHQSKKSKIDQMSLDSNYIDDSQYNWNLTAQLSIQELFSLQHQPI